MTPEQTEKLIPSITSCEERGPRLVGPHGGLRGELPSPTEQDLADPVFEAIWQATKTWDVNIPEYYVGYCGMNGSHVMLILSALRAAADKDAETVELKRLLTNAKSEAECMAFNFRVTNKAYIVVDQQMREVADELKRIVSSLPAAAQEAKP